MRLKILYLLVAIILVACRQQERGEKVRLKAGSEIPLKYARRFSMAEGEGHRVIYLFGNRGNRDTTSVFILYKDQKPEINNNRAYAIKTPCKKMAVLSSIYAAMFCELESMDAIAAIDNLDYVINPLLIKKVTGEKLPELAKGPLPDAEATIKLGPDIVFTFGMGDGRDENEKLKQAGIPVAISVDHLESSPLARAEWIRFFGAFVDKDSLAEVIFNGVEENYHRLRDIAKTASVQPTVFNEIKYGDTWYMPGGRSYVATLLADAGANYLWKEDTLQGSLPLSFEQVFTKAQNADYWINLSMVKTKEELLGFESRYSEFRAFKNGNLYNNNRFTNSKGYSIYWETGMIHPERILGDMVQIFHPELKQVKNDLYYYHQLK